MMLNINSAQPSTYFPLKIKKSQETQSVVPIQFPSTRNVLWESKPVGDFETLSLHQQDVQLSVVEKTLHLAQRYSEGNNTTSFLLGSIYAKSDEGGICFGVDRFDPGRDVTEKIGDIVSKCKVPTAVVPGDHIIPIKVKYDPSCPEDSLSHTKDEFSRSLQIIVAKISGKESLTLSHVISLKANLYCVKNDDEVILNLHCGAIVPNVKFQAQLIAPLPIIPTALARNLAGPMRLSDVEGAPKMGYITMDQTRKLLLLLESDPKAYSLPLIGIWISGVYSVHHSYVWACCLRYLNCTEIKDRVLHSSGSFLLLHYSVVQRLPDFWECRSNDGANLDFELLSCQEELHIDLREYNSKDLLCFYLSPATDGINKTLFDEAINEWQNQIEVSRNNKTSARRRSLNNIPPQSPGVINDETPRPSPSPHPSPTQGETIHPPVPEDSLSLSFDDMANTFNQEDLENRKENRKKLAPHFNGPTKRHSMKPFSNNSENSLKPSRQPFKQISSQTPERDQNIPQEHVRSNTPTARTRIIGGKEDKENTPLISRSVGNVKYSRKPMNTERRRLHVTKTDKVLLNHSPSAQHEKEQQQSDREHNIRAQSKKPSRVSQGFPNNSNDRNVALSESRFYSDENHPSYSPHEMRPKADLLETNQMYPEHFEKTPNHPSVGSSNEGNVGDISADSSSWEDCEDRVNDSKIIGDCKICEVATPLNSSCNFTEQVIPQQQDSAGRIKHFQKEEPDKHQSPGNAPLQEKAVEREAGDLSNGRLQEQVKRQDDMIRVLQEQVRSLLKMKEAMSSPGQERSLPMTPASTPESSNGRILKRHAENQNQSVSTLAVQTDDGVIASTPDESKAKSVAVGVNTGVSLLWNEPPQNTSRCLRCCESDYRNSKPEAQSPLFPKAEDSNNKLTPEKSESLENLSEVVVQDESNQSLPLTLNTVDIPSFDESGSVAAAADQNSYEKKCSLSFGESASVVSNQSSLSSCLEECSQSDTVSVKGREFYDKLLHQVKDLLSEHVNDEGESESSRLKSREKKVKENPPAATVPTREIVVKATLQELEKIKHSEHERPGSSSSVCGRVPGGSSSSVLQTYQRSMSTSFIPDHPKLNYISMSVDETFDEVTYLDEVALKYLSDEEVNVFKNELHPMAAGTVKRSFTRTVRFGSLPNERERRSPSKELRSVREVDFTWNNLSLCTKNYLTKYNLVEKHLSFSAKDEEDKSGKNVDQELSKEDPQESLEVPCKPPFPSPVRKSSGDKNEILDIRRLKNLPKLF